MRPGASSKSRSIIFTATASIVFTASLPVPEAMAGLRYSPAAREGKINFQGALAAQRNLFYQHEARMARLGAVLNKPSRMGDLAKPTAAGIASGGQLGSPGDMGYRA